MKRIVNGHYADADSTKDLVDVTEEELLALKFALNQHRKKFEITKKLSDEQLQIKLDELKKNYPEGSDEKTEMDKFTPQSMREDMEYDLRQLALVNAKIVLLESNKKTTPITGITNEQYKVLIDAVRYTVLDIEDALNYDADESIKLATQLNSECQIMPEEQLKTKAEKLKDEKWQDEMHYKMKVLFGILQNINQPYEGTTYTNSTGDVLDTSSYFSQLNTSRTDVN